MNRITHPKGRRLFELERIFINWSNSLDNDLLRISRFGYLQTTQSLIEQRNHYRDSEIEIQELGEEYMTLNNRKNHPNYEKSLLRLSILHKLIANELAFRFKKI